MKPGMNEINFQGYSEFWKPACACPYPEGSDNRFDWEKGYAIAAAEFIKRLFEKSEKPF